MAFSEYLVSFKIESHKAEYGPHKPILWCASKLDAASSPEKKIHLETIDVIDLLQPEKFTSLQQNCIPCLAIVLTSVITVKPRGAIKGGEHVITALWLCEFLFWRKEFHCPVYYNWTRAIQARS